MYQSSEYNLLELISDTVEDYYSIPRGHLKIVIRKTEIKEPRQIAMYFGMQLLYPKNKSLYSQTKMGKFFGKDHATVIHANKRISGLIETDKILRVDVEEIGKKINERFSVLDNSITLKKLFLLGQGIVINGYSKHINQSFSFDVCCAVALQNNFDITQIAAYTGCEKLFIQTRITYAYAPKIKEMNELLKKYFSL